MVVDDQYLIINDVIHDGYAPMVESLVGFDTRDIISRFFLNKEQAIQQVADALSGHHSRILLHFKTGVKKICAAFPLDGKKAYVAIFQYNKNQIDIRKNRKSRRV